MVEYTNVLEGSFAHIRAKKAQLQKDREYVPGKYRKVRSPVKRNLKVTDRKLVRSKMERIKSRLTID